MSNPHAVTGARRSLVCRVSRLELGRVPPVVELEGVEGRVFFHVRFAFRSDLVTEC